MVSGTARSYRSPIPGTSAEFDGLWDEVEPDEEAEHCTRMHMVRPIDAGINGVVIANWQNVTAGVDLGMPPREAFGDYAWVGVTTQRVAMEDQPELMAWDAAYGRELADQRFD